MWYPKIPHLFIFLGYHTSSAINRCPRWYFGEFSTYRHVYRPGARGCHAVSHVMVQVYAGTLPRLECSLVQLLAALTPADPTHPLSTLAV